MNAISEHNHIPLGCATIFLHPLNSCRSPLQVIEETTLNYHTPDGGLTKALYNFRKDSIKKCKLCPLDDSIPLVGFVDYILDMYVKI